MSFGSIERFAKQFLQDIDTANSKFMQISNESSQTVKDSMNNRLKLKRLIDDHLIPTNRFLKDIESKKKDLETDRIEIDAKLEDIDRLLKAQLTKASNACKSLEKVYRQAIQDYPDELGKPMNLSVLVTRANSKLELLWTEYLLRQQIVMQTNINRQEALSFISMWNHFPYLDQKLLVEQIEF